MKLSGLTYAFVAVVALFFGGATAALASTENSEATEHIVEIIGFKYIPESIIVKPGDTVTWINRDIVPHTATANDLSFDTGELKKNESASITFTSDQTMSYFCEYHPSMRAKVLFE